MRIFLVLFLGLITWSCTKSEPLFVKNSDTGISFKNTLTESSAYNILSYEYFYNGGGLGSGDFNNDGLTDLYFAGNQVENHLYINVGNLKFTKSDLGPKGKPNSWKTGVSLVDINQDGWLDIYQCYSGLGETENLKNELYINQGLKNGKWSAEFKEEAEKYGLADAGRSTQAAFFDYDLDGDLDAYVMNHNLKNYQRKEAALMKTDVDELAGDRLYLNEKGFFKNISQKVGIKSNPLGFGLGLAISDLNQDGFPDIYVANDYVEEDYLYLNQKNGTFKDIGKEAMGHFSYSSMGVDIADVNNDALPDVFTCDMLPPDSKRQKLLAFPDNWNVQQSMLENGFHWQNMRNMLQINKGLNAGIPQFSEIGQLAGVSATDWSWGPVLADFDADGFKDLFVSNGFVKDLTDLDFVKYMYDAEQQTGAIKSKNFYLELLKSMPSTPTHHYVFKNQKNQKFSDFSTDWGLGQNAVAGASLAVDLDNDGDLDLITNNTDSPSLIYENTLKEKSFIKVDKLTQGDKVFVYEKGESQFQENYACRGFQSSSNSPLSFFVKEKIDSIVIISGKEKFKSVDIKLNVTLSKKSFSKLLFKESLTINTVIFNNGEQLLPAFSENTFNDFSRQILLPKKYSGQGPHVLSADFNGDKIEDLFICAPSGSKSKMLFGDKAGKFIPNTFDFKSILGQEDNTAHAFDANADGFLDLYVATGAYEQALDDDLQQDRLYLNTGNGGFKEIKLPNTKINSYCVQSFDADADKDLDLIIGGGVRSGLFPYEDSSIILYNDGKGNFSEKQRLDLGIVRNMSTLSTGLLVVSELKEPKLLVKNKDKWELSKEPIFQSGLYTAAKTVDLDKDGDLDIILGNLGTNTALTASLDKPMQVWAGDPDQNMIVDIYMAKYFGDQLASINGRDELLEQSTFLKPKFINYKSFSETSLEGLFEPSQKEKLDKYSISNLSSGILWNHKDKYKWEEFPAEAQYANVNAINVLDVDNDGTKEVILLGNEQNFRIRIGKTDANYGCILKWNPKTGFKFIPNHKSGFYIKGDVKSATINNGTLVLGLHEKGVFRYSLNLNQKSILSSKK